MLDIIGSETVAFTLNSMTSAKTKSQRKSDKAAKVKKSALEMFWKNITRPGGVEKLPTGIKGFDETLHGGIPKDRALLIIGEAGSGKTVFLNEFLYRGITEFNQPGIFVTFEERPSEIIKNVKNFGWDYTPLIKENKLAFVDASPEISKSTKKSGAEWLPAMLARIKSAVKLVNAKRAVVDNVAAIFERYQDIAEQEEIRETLFLLFDEFKKMGVTVMLSSEKMKEGNALSRYGVEEYVADGVLDVDVTIGQNQVIRRLNIRKIRGVGYRSGSVEFDITSDGVVVYPKIPADSRVASTDFKIKKPFGIPELDKSLSGGIPQGHMVMIGGNTGTGKTTLGLHFIYDALKNKEPAVWVALEESIPQIKKTALEHGWDFERYEKEGLLKFINSSLIDISPDKILYQIVDAVNESGAKRVIVDSVSSIESGTMSKEKVRQFLIQMTVFLKTVGTTCIMNYLTTETYNSSAGNLLGNLNTNEMRLSSIVDGIILLRYTERKNKVKKLLTILKMRGSQHDKDIFDYELTKNGFELGSKTNNL